MENLATHLRLPAWLDTLLFDRLGARYHRARTGMNVIDWDRDDVRSYLGTYFPRSYAEARCLFTAWFGSHAAAWRERTSLRVFDFGCGTGGEVFGLLDAVARCLPDVREVAVAATDGNHHALRLFERVGEAFAAHTSLRFRLHPLAFTVDDAADLRVLGDNIAPASDLVLSCKAVCELVSRGVFAPENAYACLARFCLPRLEAGGLMLLADVTTYNPTAQAWLPDLMDAGLAEAGCTVAARNAGFNQTFTVAHSRQARDVSKIAWRFITKP